MKNGRQVQIAGRPWAKSFHRTRWWWDLERSALAVFKASRDIYIYLFIYLYMYIIMESKSSESSEDLHSWNLFAFLMANRRPGLPGPDLCGLCGLELAASARRFLWKHKPLGTFGWNNKNRFCWSKSPSFSQNKQTNFLFSDLFMSLIRIIARWRNSLAPSGPHATSACPKKRWPQSLPVLPRDTKRILPGEWCNKQYLPCQKLKSQPEAVKFLKVRFLKDFSDHLPCSLRFSAILGGNWGKTLLKKCL
jgi:hypothetical protein